MIFETVRLMLEALDAHGRTQFADWEDRVQASLIALESDYRKLITPGRTPIAYGDLSTQAAYVYRYVYGHAEFIYEFLKAARAATGEPLFDQTVLTVASIGGGPGSELLGLLKYLEDENDEPQVERIIYTVLDKEPSWHDVVKLAISSVDTNIKLRVIFQTVDVSKSPIPKEASLHEEDVVFMSFFISEVCKLPEQDTISANIRKLLSSMSATRKLFYKDSNAYSFYSYLNSQVRMTKSFKELVDIPEKYCADTPVLDGIFSEYAEDFGYGLKLSGNAVSKVLERI